VLPTLTPENSDIVSDISSGSIRSMNILTLLLSDILSGIHSNNLSDILSGSSGPGVPSQKKNVRIGTYHGHANNKFRK